MIRNTIIALFACGLALAFVLVFAQRPFPDASFEYGLTRAYRGTLALDPFPLLRTSEGNWPLVGAGKHGAEPDVKGLERAVELNATSITRGRLRMLEVAPGSVHSSPALAAPADQVKSLGHRRLTGEIVDSKCYLGVMNPGAGKTHRACAARCLHGGVPPALATSDGQFVWLRSQRNLSGWAGDRVTVEGDWLSANGVEFLSVVTLTRTE